ncbi:MAG: outer membrane beta-barrel protein [Pseudomonadota bacterium]
MTRKQILMSMVTGFAGLLITATANAALVGPYIGGALGWGDIHQTDIYNIKDNDNFKSKDDGLAGRVFGGIQFHPNVAAEMGYTKFTNATASSSISDTGFAESSDLTIKSYAVDLVAKLTLPLQNNFSLFAKGGAAYLNEQLTETNTETNLGVTTATQYNATDHKVFPTFGLGASYELNKNVTTDISWMHIQKVGDSNLRNTDFVGLGLTYTIG